MEKLQVAIEQARRKREGKRDVPPRATEKAAPGAVAPARTAERPRSSSRSSTPLWSQLREIQVPLTADDERRLVAMNPNRNAQYFDVLRTKVLIELRKNGWRRVAITSPKRSCGKTTTACNLAVALGRQTDVSTMLFDFDLRRPAVHKLFAHSPAHEIAEVLRGEVPFSEQAVRVGENLAICMSLNPVRDSAPLLASGKSAAAIDEIEKAFAPDVMIFDLPPLLEGDDARSFLKNVDCAILLARAESTTLEQIDVCEREIAEQTNVLGVVLNECHFAETPVNYGPAA